MELKVTGMHCEHCEAKVKNALEKLNGVTNVSASHIDNKVTFDLEENTTSIKEIIKTIKGLGFKAK